MASTPIDQAMAVALQLHAAGRVPEAESIVRQILAVAPQHAEALNLLGVIAHQCGRSDVAVELFRQSLAAQPNDASAHNNLAVALTEVGRIDEAIVSARRAIGLKPDYAEAHFNLGNALKERGALDEARSAFERAIQLKPGYAKAHLNLGALLSRRGELDQAIAAFRVAIQMQPEQAVAYSNLGLALGERGDLDEAMAACNKAIALDPRDANAHNNLGLVLKGVGQVDRAIAAYRAALELKRDHVRAHSNLVHAMHYHPGSSARAIAEEHTRWNERHALPLMKLAKPHRNSRVADRMLRVGYVSPDFGNHVVGQNMLPLMREHDRSRFHITCYANNARDDEMTAAFQAHADRWRSIFAMSDERVAEQVREDEIDILVDLALHTANNRLLVFARKPAPMQMTFAGYPASTGLTSIDERLSDPYLDPPGMDETVYSERTTRLGDSFWCYDPLDARDISVSALPVRAGGTITFGCLNNFSKINETVLALWAQIMKRVAGSRLLLLAAEGAHRERTKRFLTERGVEGSRVEFAPRCGRREYLSLYGRVDVSLDTFPYNGHTTSLDSLWMGVPVVTLVGETSVGRAGWSQLSNLRLTELAGRTPDEFVEIAVEIAGDVQRLAELRRVLRGRMEHSPLMDARGFAQSIESAYGDAWGRWCARG